MTASFATLSFTRPTQRPISFVHYSGPKEIGKSTATRVSRDHGAIDDSLESTETISFPEIVEPSGPATREPPTVIDDECFETHGVTQQDGSERSTIDEALAERRVSTDADQVATYQVLII
ncbi:hypothetical protein MPH_10174 [Macrophomina phaseolina MS6]|uniref:Uncharacterized protein n=1 Tax=Macrophomina phaseolina (strain MS6) TaxID=1126212 RepID=K2QS36_MACPH|nr:hypothetical protein MPH_10174 [Macrophomina phaseolina MS6]